MIEMSLDDLNEFLEGMLFNYSDETATIEYLKLLINRKEQEKNKKE